MAEQEQNTENQNTQNTEEANQTQENLGQQLQGFSDLVLNCRALLGKIKMPVSQFVKLTRGSIVELPKKKTDLLDININNIKVAEGEIVIREDKIAIEIAKVYKKPKI